MRVNKLLLASSCLSFRPMELHGFQWTGVHEIWYLIIF